MDSADIVKLGIELANRLADGSPRDTSYTNTGGREATDATSTIKCPRKKVIRW